MKAHSGNFGSRVIGSFSRITIDGWNFSWVGLTVRGEVGLGLLSDLELVCGFLSGAGRFS
jgi:hypothetical protein